MSSPIFELSTKFCPIPENCPIIGSDWVSRENRGIVLAHPWLRCDIGVENTHDVGTQLRLHGRYPYASVT